MWPSRCQCGKIFHDCLLLLLLLGPALAQPSAPAGQQTLVSVLEELSGAATWTSSLVLNVSGRGLTGPIPAWLGNATWLMAIDLSQNFLSGALPPELGRLTNLQALDLHQNQLSGPLPSELGALSSLRSLNLSYNTFSGPLPSTLGNLAALESLDLSANSFEGPIPPELGNLSQLLLLNLNENQLSGPIPEALGQLQLQDLRLGINKLSGHLPVFLTRMTSLRSLFLLANELTGPIPPEISNLSELRLLDLGQNRFNGTIPPQLGQLSKLEMLMLNPNWLTGPIPRELGNLSNLKALQLSGNGLMGTIPAELGRLSKLIQLDMYQNELTGTISQLSGLTNLEHLVLSRNRLSGDISVIANFPKLKMLWLTDNQFTGPLPREFGALTSLDFIDLSFNSFVGSIPRELGQCVKLTTLTLNNNMLNGSIPREIGQLKRLTNLRLGFNQLVGEVPEELGQFPLIRSLNVESNRALTGHFPDTTASVLLVALKAYGCNFTSAGAQSRALLDLDLSDNQLEMLPPGIENLSNLKSLQLSRNRIQKWPLRGVRVVETIRCIPVNTNNMLIEERFQWQNMMSLDVSDNPLNMPAQAFLDSLAYLWLIDLRCARCGLHGSVHNGEWVSGGQDDCSNFRIRPNLLSLLKLDLAGNQISGILIGPPLNLQEVNLSSNSFGSERLLTADSSWTLHPWWLNLEGWSHITVLDITNNPQLTLDVQPLDQLACDAVSRKVRPLKPDPTGPWTKPGAETLYECTGLCTWDDFEIDADGTSLNTSSMCRCSMGTMGSRTNCTVCPRGFYSFVEEQSDLLGLNRTCKKCGIYQTTDRNGSESSKACRCDPQIEGLVMREDGCACALEAEFVDLEHKRCVPCPTGWVVTASSEKGKGPCSPSVIFHLLYNTVLMLATFGGIMFPYALGLPPVHVVDVGMEQGRWVISTRLRHRMLPWAPRSIPVHLTRTNHPTLDGKLHRVHVLGPNSLELVTVGQERSTETSMGLLRVRLPYALLFCGLAGLPASLWSAASYAFAAILAMTWKMTRETVLPIYVLSVLFSTIFHICRCWMASRTPLAVRHDKWLSVLEAENPAPKRNLRGSGRAVSAKQLVEFANFFRNFIGRRDMYYVCSNLIKPLTEHVKLSYAELAGPHQVVWFVSHFWGDSFQHLVDTLSRHAASVAGSEWEKETYWVCSFSNNQWQLEKELGKMSAVSPSKGWERSSFYLALRSSTCRGTLMVLDEAAWPLQRTWCLFEVAQTLQLSGQRRGFEGLLLGTSSGVLNFGSSSTDVAMAVASRLATLDVRNATATDKQDHDMIMELVADMDGGFDAVNGYVRHAIREALVKTHSSLNQDFRKLVHLLKTGSGSLRAPPPLAPGQSPKVAIDLFLNEEEDLEEGKGASGLSFCAPPMLHLAARISKSRAKLIAAAMLSLLAVAVMILLLTYVFGQSA